MNFNHLWIQFLLFPEIPGSIQTSKYASYLHTHKGSFRSFIFYENLLYHLLSRIHMIWFYIFFLYRIFIGGHRYKIFGIFRYIPRCQHSTTYKYHSCKYKNEDTCELMLFHSTFSFPVSLYLPLYSPAGFLLLFLRQAYGTPLPGKQSPCFELPVQLPSAENF